MGVVGWGVWRLGGVVQGGHWGMGARHLDCDGGLGPRKGGWLQRLSLLRVWEKLSIWRWGRWQLHGAKGPECPQFWFGRGWWWKRRLLRSSGLPLRCLRRQGGTSNCEGVRGRPVLWLRVHRWVLLWQSDLLAVGVHVRGWVGRLGWCRLPIELHPKVPSRWQWLRCADHRCVGHVGRWGLPLGCRWWPVHRLRGTLWLLHVQVGQRDP